MCAPSLPEENPARGSGSPDKGRGNPGLMARLRLPNQKGPQGNPSSAFGFCKLLTPRRHLVPGSHVRKPMPPPVGHRAHSSCTPTSLRPGAGPAGGPRRPLIIEAVGRGPPSQRLREEASARLGHTDFPFLHSEDTSYMAFCPEPWSAGPAPVPLCRGVKRGEPRVTAQGLQRLDKEQEGRAQTHREI